MIGPHVHMGPIKRWNSCIPDRPPPPELCLQLRRGLAVQKTKSIITNTVDKKRWWWFWQVWQLLSANIGMHPFLLSISNQRVNRSKNISTSLLSSKKTFNKTSKTLKNTLFCSTTNQANHLKSWQSRWNLTSEGEHTKLPARLGQSWIFWSRAINIISQYVCSPPSSETDSQDQPRLPAKDKKSLKSEKIWNS